MQSNYTTVLDAGAAQLPQVPLIVVLSVPVLLLAFGHVATARKWRSAGGPPQPLSWRPHLSYAPLVLLACRYFRIYLIK